MTCFHLLPAFLLLAAKVLAIADLAPTDRAGIRLLAGRLAESLVPRGATACRIVPSSDSRLASILADELRRRGFEPAEDGIEVFLEAGPGTDAGGERRLTLRVAGEPSLEWAVDCAGADWVDDDALATAGARVFTSRSRERGGREAALAEARAEAEARLRESILGTVADVDAPRDGIARTVDRVLADRGHAAAFETRRFIAVETTEDGPLYTAFVRCEVPGAEYRRMADETRERLARAQRAPVLRGALSMGSLLLCVAGYLRLDVLTRGAVPGLLRAVCATVFATLCAAVWLLDPV